MFFYKMHCVINFYQTTQCRYDHRNNTFQLIILLQMLKEQKTLEVHANQQEKVVCRLMFQLHS